MRPAADFHKGHIINSLNIPMNGFSNQLATLEKHKQRPIIIGCRSGAQSASACQILRKQGYEQVYNLRGGILAWQSRQSADHAQVTQLKVTREQFP